MADPVKNARSAMFPAQSAQLRNLTGFVERFCAAQDIERPRCLRLNVVLEELFINTVRHGHRRDSEAPIWVMLAAAADAVRVTYEDTAPPFNPFAHLPAKGPDTTLEMRKIGGLGVLLARELSQAREYAYVFGRNRIRLQLMR
jgi:serine/threonine-protein kinase RsbW